MKIAITKSMVIDLFSLIALQENTMLENFSNKDLTIKLYLEANIKKQKVKISIIKKFAYSCDKLSRLISLKSPLIKSARIELKNSLSNKQFADGASVRALRKYVMAYKKSLAIKNSQLKKKNKKLPNHYNLASNILLTFYNMILAVCNLNILSYAGIVLSNVISSYEMFANSRIQKIKMEPNNKKLINDTTKIINSKSATIRNLIIKLKMKLKNIK